MHVLVSGAGVAGATLAWHLAKSGVRVTIIDKSPTLLPSGQNVDVKGSALTVIDKMGLMDQLRKYNTTEEGTKFIDSQGQPFAPFPVTQGASASFTAEFEILRADLAKMLYEATKDHPNVSYLLGTTVEEVISNDDESVKVKFSNGKIQDFDVLVASDGQWSKIRKLCFRPEDVRVIDKDMYVAYWTVPRLPTDDNWWNIYIALGSRIITLRPDPHGTIRAMFTRMPCNDAQRKAWQEASRSDKKTQQDLLRREFADAGWNVHRLLDGMEQAPDFYFHAVQQIKMSRWSNGRVVCLGDTAWAPTPLTGMGTSLAIVGAYILAGELGDLNEDDKPFKALKAFENKFRPVVEVEQQIPRFVPEVAHPDTVWKRWLLQTFTAALSFLASWLVLYRQVTKTGTRDTEFDFPLPRYARFEEDDKQDEAR